MKTIRVAIFEDNTQLRESLFDLVDISEGFSCVGAFANCQRVIQNVEETRPDVILMDIEMPVVSGIRGGKTDQSKIPAY
jgi:DNA-binding NarL/FixJ family response regulator